MIKNRSCSYCSSTEFSVINTYKHHWLSCNDCGNMVRERKSAYLLERLPKFLRKKLPVAFQKALFREQNVIQDEANYYSYYGDTSANGSAAGTKWRDEFETLVSQLARHNVELSDKDVLDISGGPGFVVKQLHGVARRAVVTEFSQAAVDGMVKHLGIEGAKYDFNSDRLNEVVVGKFDVVLVRYAFNFCMNPNEFASSLRHLLRDNAVVHVSFVLPSLGCCLRWQHDEYTYNVLYNPETIIRAFSEEGYSLIARESDGDYAYTRGRSLKVNLLALPYRIAALSRLRNVNRQLLQKNRVLIFRPSKKTDAELPLCSERQRAGAEKATVSKNL